MTSAFAGDSAAGGPVGASMRQKRNLDIQRWVERSRSSGGKCTSDGSSDGVARRAIRNRQNIIGSGRLQFGGTGRTPVVGPTRLGSVAAAAAPGAAALK